MTEMVGKAPRIVWLVVGSAFGILWIAPVIWAVITSLKREVQTLEASILPNPVTFEQYSYILSRSWLPRWYLNSTFTSVAITLLGVGAAVLCAYGLSQLHFRGKMLFMAALLATLIVPGESLLVPLYLLVADMGMLNSYSGIILPQLVLPLVVLVLKEFFDQVPRELREAALLDGASEATILRTIYLPLSSSVLAAMAIITFIGAWNSFLWPLVAVNETSMFTIPIGLTQVQETYGIRYARSMASAVLAALPVVIIYVLAQRRITRAIVATVGINE